MNLSFYRKHFNLINDDIPNTKIAMNGFGGSITLPNGSSIDLYHILRRIKVIN
jgi:hypothetical protein